MEDRISKLQIKTPRDHLKIKLNFEIAPMVFI